MTQRELFEKPISKAARDVLFFIGKYTWQISELRHDMDVVLRAAGGKGLSSAEIDAAVGELVEAGIVEWNGEDGAIRRAKE